ncbi:50S ribosomal protein L5 [candidate division KSB1 bacterium]
MEKQDKAKKAAPVKEKKARKEVQEPASKEKGKAEAKKTAASERYVPRLQELYKQHIIHEMMKLFHYKNVMQVPKLEKITINVGMGKALQNIKLIDGAVEDLTIISGQKAIVTKAKRAVSNFKLRIGNPIGTKVTLRRAHMYEFLDRFISMAIPRIRDFRGLSDKAFDGFGNYTVGIKEQIIFPEIDYDKVEIIHGMDISIVTSAGTDEESRALLKLLGMPFVETESAA